MAFEKKGRGELTFKKLTDLEVGESVTGYLIGIDESTKIEGALNIRLRVNGKTVSYSVAGNVKYMIRDGELALGQNTRITRLEDTKVKGKKSSKFDVEQDASDVVSGSESLSQASNTGSTAKSNGIAEKIKGLKANATTPSTNA